MLEEMLDDMHSDDVNSEATDLYNYIDPEIAPIHTLSLTSHLWHLYKTRTGTDVTVNCSDQEFNLHYSVLTHGSDFFREELSGDERSVELKFTPDIDPVIFETIVESLYTGAIRNIDENNVTAILEASYKLQVSNAIQTCSKFMVGSLDPDNCLKYWLAAKSCDCDLAARNSYGMVGRHLKTVSKKLEFGQLQPNLLVEILIDDKLQIPSEEVVYEAAINWIKFDEESRKRQLSLVLTAVRLPLLSTNYLIRVVGKESLIENNPFAMTKYSQALKCKLHAEARADIPYKSRDSFKNALIGTFERWSKDAKTRKENEEDNAARDLTDLSIAESNQDFSESDSESDSNIVDLSKCGSSLLSFGGQLEEVPEGDDESLSTMGDKSSI